MNTSTAPQLVRFVLLLSLCLFPSLAAAQIPQFDSFFVFGDSLADNGNVLIQTRALGMDPPVPPSKTPHRTYFEGRFSNGYIGFEYLWQRLTGYAPGSPRGVKPFLAAPVIQKTGAVDFAFGGTGTPYVDQTPGGFWAPGLKGQVELFRLALLGRKPSARALYAIATGANDYRADPFNVPMNPEDVVRNIEDAVVSLYRLGARDVMVVNLPDLGKVPANGGDPNATLISQIHNGLLEGAVARLRARFPDLRLVLVELDPLFQDLETRMEAKAPLIAAFSPTAPERAACLFLNPASCVDMPAFLFNNLNLPFIFWDVVHPTTLAHRFLGDYMFDLLEAEYE
jgi:phospholipase/lecithinase/hemolysin